MKYNPAGTSKNIIPNRDKVAILYANIFEYFLLAKNKKGSLAATLATGVNSQFYYGICAFTIR